jgi:hypothetical protein
VAVFCDGVFRRFISALSRRISAACRDENTSRGCSWRRRRRRWLATIDFAAHVPRIMQILVLMGRLHVPCSVVSPVLYSSQYYIYCSITLAAVLHLLEYYIYSSIAFVAVLRSSIAVLHSSPYYIDCSTTFNAVLYLLKVGLLYCCSIIFAGCSSICAAVLYSIFATIL